LVAVVFAESAAVPVVPVVEPTVEPTVELLLGLIDDVEDE
jgi:hypothetical protein